MTIGECDRMVNDKFTRRNFLRSSVLVASGICLGGKVWSAPANQDVTGSPNIVLIVSDDQGYADSSCYDHPKEVSTPNIDRLAAEGVRLTNGYASAYVCAPTRAGLLTGRYQQRFGFYTGGDSRAGLPFLCPLQCDHVGSRTVRRHPWTGHPLQLPAPCRSLRLRRPWG